MGFHGLGGLCGIMESRDIDLMVRISSQPGRQWPYAAVSGDPHGESRMHSLGILNLWLFQSATATATATPTLNLTP